MVEFYFYFFQFQFSVLFLHCGYTNLHSHQYYIRVLLIFCLCLFFWQEEGIQGLNSGLLLAKHLGPTYSPCPYLSDSSHSYWSEGCVKTSHCGFWVRFSWWLVMLSILSYSCLSLSYPLLKMFIQVICPFLNQIITFFCCCCLSPLCMLKIIPLSDE
jgi:hypothetical protein